MKLSGYLENHILLSVPFDHHPCLAMKIEPAIKIKLSE